jgi:hypothetical protein
MQAIEVLKLGIQNSRVAECFLFWRKPCAEDRSLSKQSTGAPSAAGPLLLPSIPRSLTKADMKEMLQDGQGTEKES